MFDNLQHKLAKFKPIYEEIPQILKIWQQKGRVLTPRTPLNPRLIFIIFYKNVAISTLLGLYLKF